MAFNFVDVFLRIVCQTPRIFLPALISFLASASPGWCLQTQFANTTAGDFPSRISEYTIEELMEMEFITLLKKKGNVWDTPAAVQVLPGERIERTGALTIPDALRSVPGMQVAQHNAHSWSVSSRGFDGLIWGISGQFANKFLVLHDGRSVYTPLFSGVSWEAQDVILEDVDRIEVIRGPGASLWGANAVNGVINIISKDARDTQGGLVSAGLGTQYNRLMHVRYGKRITGNTYFRVFAKYLNTDEMMNAAGVDLMDEWRSRRLGFQIDSHKSRSRLTFSGQIYESNGGELYQAYVTEENPQPAPMYNVDNMRGGNLMARYRHSFSENSDMSLQIYFDRSKTDALMVRGTIDTYDLDFNHRIGFAPEHEVIYGAGFRFISDHFDPTFQFRLDPAKKQTSIASAFVQDEIAIVPNQLKLTLGSKFEHNSYTGFEFQPGVRLFWKPAPAQVFWLAASRAVRTPSRTEADGQVLLFLAGRNNRDSTAIFLRTEGNQQFISEKMFAFEFGTRRQLLANLSLDVATFYNIYDDLRALTPPDFVFPMPIENSSHSYIPEQFVNTARGHSYGLEVLSRWQPERRLDFYAVYSLFKTRLSQSTDPLQDGEGRSPQHQFHFISNYQPLPRLQTDLRFRYVGARPVRGIPAYATLDAHLALRISPGLTVTLAGQNLLEKEHVESSPYLSKSAPEQLTQTVPGQIKRSFYFKTTLQF